MLNRLLPIALLIIAGLVGVYFFSFHGPMNSASPDSTSGLASNIPAKVDEYLNAYVEQGRFSGSVLIAQGDEVFIRNGYSQANREHNVPNTPETKFRLGSVTKPFTAVAILQLQQQGKLNVVDPVSTHLPNYPDGDRITIENLLRHTSGIPNFTDFDDYEQTMRLDLSLEEIVDRFKGRDLAFDPGSQYAYSNSNYLLLGHLIERVSGQSYSSYLNEHIFRPIGMADSGYDRRATILEDRAEGYSIEDGELSNAAFIDMSIPHAAGALYSTVDDLYKWDRALSTDQLLDASLREQMFTPGQGNYGYGWAFGEFAGHRLIEHSGGINGFRAILSRFPDDDVAIIVLSNFEHAPVSTIRTDLAAIVFGQSYQLPTQRQAVQLDPSVLASYAGAYRLDAQTTVAITVEGDHLGIQLTGQPRFDLYPMSETEFFLRAIDAEVSFVTNDTGEVTELVIHQGGQDVPAERISGDPAADGSSDG